MDTTDTRNAAALSLRGDALVLDTCLLPCSGPASTTRAAEDVPSDVASSTSGRNIAEEGAHEEPINLQILHAVQSIQAMQGTLKQEMLRMQGEILQHIEAVQVPKPPGPPHLGSSPHGHRSKRAPAPSLMQEADRCQVSQSSVRFEPIEPVAVDIPSPVGDAEAELVGKGRSTMMRYETAEYVDQFMADANLHETLDPMRTDSSIISLHTAIQIPKSTEDMKRKFRRSAVRRLLQWHGFDVCIGWVILLNSVCIGWEINISARGNVSAETLTALKAFEYSFLVIYSAELLLRFYADGLSALRSSWVAFDFALVLSGLVAAVIRHVVQAVARRGHVLGGEAVEAMDQVMLFRIIRLLRLVRALRLIRQFTTLWRLVNGLLASLDTMLSTLALLALLLYLSACIGMEMIAGNDALREDPDLALLIDTEYDSVPNTMLTLIQFVTMDDLSELYKPIIRKQPITCIYFITILMVVPIALLNLVTAVLVEGALEKSRIDSEMKAMNLREQVHGFMPLVRDLFRSLESDVCGVLTRAQFQQKLEEEAGHEEIKRKLREIIPFDSVAHLFESLDVNDNGELLEQEFVSGILSSAQGGNDNMELTQIMRFLNVLGRKLEKIEAGLGAVTALRW